MDVRLYELPRPFQNGQDNSLYYYYRQHGVDSSDCAVVVELIKARH